MSGEALLESYDNKIVHCCKLISSVDYEIKIMKNYYDSGILKNKKHLIQYLNQAENKKKVYLDQIDNYFRQMELIMGPNSKVVV